MPWINFLEGNWTALKEGEQNPCENTKDQGTQTRTHTHTSISINETLREPANRDTVSLIMYDCAWESLEAPPSTENIHEKQALLEDLLQFLRKTNVFRAWICLRLLEPINNYSQNGDLMVFYHGRKFKKKHINETKTSKYVPT